MLLLSQSDFEKFADDLAKQKKSMSQGEKLSLARFLSEREFFPSLEGINFSHEKTVVQTVGISRTGSMSTVTTVPRTTNLLTELDFSGCTIRNCNFNYCDLSGSQFENLVIESCNFNHVLMNHCTLKNTRFLRAIDGQRCSFVGTSFDYSQLQQTLFQNCYFARSFFNYLDEFKEILFENCPIYNVSIIGGSPAQDVTIRFSSKMTCTEISLTTDKKINLDQVTINSKQPSILISWNNKVPTITGTLTEKMLMHHHLHPVRMDYFPIVDEVKLNHEINELHQLTAQKMEQYKNVELIKFKKISAAKELKMAEGSEAIESSFEEHWRKKCISFSMLMIEVMREKHAEDVRAFTQMAALYTHAESMYNSVDGILIPGGQDIDPRFYGKPLESKTILPKYNPNTELSDPRRDTLEFSLIYMQQRASVPKPLLGICRGSQTIAASYGATMYQDIGDAKRWAYFIEPIVLSSAEKKPSEPEETSVLSTRSRLNAYGKGDTLNVLFIHHQGFNLKTAHGLTATASTVTESGVPIDIVGEHLQQNITLTQAHPEFAFDKTKHTKGKGIFTKVSARALESILGQFEMRVWAYQNSKQVNKELLQAIEHSSIPEPLPIHHSTTVQEHGFFASKRGKELTTNAVSLVANQISLNYDIL